MNNASTQNVWTSYRDGRRVMHYMVADNCRYYVQKTEVGYHISQVFVAAESVHLMTAATLALGKRYAEEHANRGFVDVSLDDLKAKLKDEPLHECEIPGTPGRVTHGKPLEFAVTDGSEGAPPLEWYVIGSISLTRDALDEAESRFYEEQADWGPQSGASNDITPGVHTVRLTGAQDDGRGGISVGFEVIGSRPGINEMPKGVYSIPAVQIIGRCKRIRPHRPATYNSITLGIDSFKVVRMGGVSRLEQFKQVMAQADRVCRIEQELVQYEGKRRTPNRDRKVAKLRKIMRILKRGLYE